ncbi:hypothetical protein Sjap_003847 [Stephania japonica]|uniref:Uncharacterized protein n=1 Tax=Stephania japonica TaxID=461633 RepID=A0AAP0PTZ6_9MAGN
MLNRVSQFMKDVCRRAFANILQRLVVIRERKAVVTISVGHEPFMMPVNFGVRSPMPLIALGFPPRYVVVQDTIVMPQIGMTAAMRMNESLTTQQKRTFVKLRLLPDAVVDIEGEEVTVILTYLETWTLPPSVSPNVLDSLIPVLRGSMDSRLAYQFLQEQ